MHKKGKQYNEKKYLVLSLTSVLFVLIFFSINFKVDSSIAPKYTPSIVPQNMSVQIKRERFYALVEPAI